jgi:hypothetical protein
MNCCDEYGDCRQGRDCPVRTGAQVAKVGRRVHGPEPLPPSLWHVYMRALAKALLLTLAVMLVSALTVLLIPKSVRYDCATAEFHPDATLAVKTECRKKRTTT